MDLSKIISKLDTIEDHTERAKRIEDLLEKILESTQRSERHLENMWRMYEQAANAAQNQQQRM